MEANTEAGKNPERGKPTGAGSPCNPAVKPARHARSESATEAGEDRGREAVDRARQLELKSA